MCEQLRSLFQVLQVIFLQLLMLIKDVVYFLMERQQVVVNHLHSVSGIECLLQIIKLTLALFRGLLFQLSSRFLLQVLWCDVRILRLWLGLLRLKLMTAAVGCRGWVLRRTVGRLLLKIWR